jgi:hypothetical protein
VLAGVPVAHRHRSLLLGDPGCGLRSPQRSPRSRLAAGDRRSRLGLEVGGAAAVRCAAGSPAYGHPLACLPASNNWSGLRCWVHGRAFALALGRFVSIRRCPEVAPPMSRNGYFSITCTTLRLGCVLARSVSASVVGRKVRDPATTTGSLATSVSFHPRDVTTDEHRTHASA